MARNPKPPTPRSAQFFGQVHDFARQPQVDNLLAVSAAVMLIHRERQYLDDLVDVGLFATSLPPDFAENYEATTLSAFGRDGSFDCKRLLASLEKLDTPFEAAAVVSLLLRDIKREKRQEIIELVGDTVAARVHERKTH